MVENDFDTSDEIENGITDDQMMEFGQSIEDDLADDDEEEATDQSESDDAENNEEDTSDTDENDGDVEDQEQVPVFADEQHKVKLPDGSETTVHELMRGNLREADYTKKTMELSEGRKQVEQQEAKLAEVTNLVGQAIQQYQPQKPRYSDYENDPMAYQQALGVYEDQMEVFNSTFGSLNQVQQQMKAQGDAKRGELLQQEHQSMIAKHPEFADQVKFNEFQTKAIPAFGDFGFTPEELGKIDDHRMIGVMKEVLEYRELKANRQKAVKQTQNKPKMVTGSNRKTSNPRDSKSVQNRINRAAKSGDARDVADILGKLLEG
jgi:hypothetical protein